MHTELQMTCMLAYILPGSNWADPFTLQQCSPVLQDAVTGMKLGHYLSTLKYCHAVLPSSTAWHLTKDDLKGIPELQKRFPKAKGKRSYPAICLILPSNAWDLKRTDALLGCLGHAMFPGSFTPDRGSLV